jgi:hypothetical protein
MSNPWETELDHVEFECEGYHCVVHRVSVDPKGHLCGYVVLPSGHPWHGISNEWDVPAEAHGGITYSKSASTTVERGAIEGSYTTEWVIGFDCAHYCDYCPQYTRAGAGFGDPANYRTVEYVRRELEALVGQCAAIYPVALDAGFNQFSVCKRCGDMNTYIPYNSNYVCRLCNERESHHN